MDPIASDVGMTDDHQTAVKRGMAMAYVWGRQDGGDSERDTGYSQAFASVYALADRLTGGYVGNLQGAHHEWTATGRLLIRMAGTDNIVAVQVPEGAPDTTRAAAYPIPWAGSAYLLRHWPGKINRPRTTTCNHDPAALTTVEVTQCECGALVDPDTGRVLAS